MADAAKSGRKQVGRPFTPGTSGNPNGRPIGSRNKATIILDAIADGEAAEILAGVVDAAKKGDLKAAEILLSRVWPARKSRTLVLGLPEIRSSSDILEALGRTIRAMGSGEISTDEAAAIAGVLEQNRKAFEIIEIEARLTKLERERKS